MNAKLIKFPEALTNEIEDYAMTLAPEGERSNFSAAVRDLIRIGLEHAGQCQECGATCYALACHCDDCWDRE